MASKKKDVEVATTEEFGSERLKELMIAAAADEGKMAILLREIEDIIYNYAMYRLKCGFKPGEIRGKSKPLVVPDEIKRQISDADFTTGTRSYHEFVGDAIMTVGNAMPNFLKKLNNYPEANQRRAWLRSVIYNTLVKYLKDWWKAKKKLGEEVSYYIETDENTKGNSGTIERRLPNPLETENVVIRNCINDAETSELIMRIVCGMNSKPHNIISFIMNKVIVFGEKECKYNCDAKEVCRILNGVSLFEAKSIIADKFYDIYGVVLDPGVIRPLERKLGENEPTELGNVRYKYTTDKTKVKDGEVMINERYLANITNQITKKLKILLGEISGMRGTRK